MSSVQDWHQPKPNSGRRCLLCGKAPAGKAHIKVSWFRGDDEVRTVCKACGRLPNAEEMLLCDHEFFDVKGGRVFTVKSCLKCGWAPSPKEVIR